MSEHIEELALEPSAGLRVCKSTWREHVPENPHGVNTLQGLSV